MYAKEYSTIMNSLDQLNTNIEKVIVGKGNVIDLLMTAFIAGVMFS